MHSAFQKSLLIQDPKCSFHIKAHFAFHLEMKIPYYERIEVAEVESKSSTISQDSTDLLPNLKLKGSLCFPFLTDFLFQADLAPFQTVKSINTCTVLDWLANSSDPKPTENLLGVLKRKIRDTRPNNADKLKEAIKATLKKSFLNTSAVPQDDHLNATLQWCSNSFKSIKCTIHGDTLN